MRAELIAYWNVATVAGGASEPVTCVAAITVGNVTYTAVGTEQRSRYGLAQRRRRSRIHRRIQLRCVRNECQLLALASPQRYDLSNA